VRIWEIGDLTVFPVVSSAHVDDVHPLLKREPEFVALQRNPDPNADGVPGEEFARTTGPTGSTIRSRSSGRCRVTSTAVKHVAVRLQWFSAGNLRRRRSKRKI